MVLFGVCGFSWLLQLLHPATKIKDRFDVDVRLLSAHEYDAGNERFIWLGGIYLIQRCKIRKCYLVSKDVVTAYRAQEEQLDRLYIT